MLKRLMTWLLNVSSSALSHCSRKTAANWRIVQLTQCGRWTHTHTVSHTHAHSHTHTHTHTHIHTQTEQGQGDWHAACAVQCGLRTYQYLEGSPLAAWRLTQACLRWGVGVGVGGGSPLTATFSLLWAPWRTSCPTMWVPSRLATAPGHQIYHAYTCSMSHAKHNIRSALSNNQET